MYIKRKVFDVMRMKSNKRTPKSFRDKLISTVTGRVRTRACSFISRRMFKIRRPTYHFPIVIYDHRDSSERVIAAVAVRVLSDRDALQENKLIKNNLGVTTVTTSTSCTFIIRYTRTLPPQKFAEVNSRATRIRIRCIKVPSPTPPPSSRRWIRTKTNIVMYVFNVNLFVITRVFWFFEMYIFTHNA